MRGRAGGWVTSFGTALFLSLAAAPAIGIASAPDATPDQIVALLTSLHPDYHLYIGDVRYGSSRLRPETHYAGLVRPGGDDPADPEDGPVAGRGAVNDLVIYADMFEIWRTPAWRLLVADHEYFHARHLAKGFDLPVVGFGRGDVDADYYEALAWEYVVRRSAAGLYGQLGRREAAEAAARYAEHYKRFFQFVMSAQPSAWAHYGRFLPDPLRQPLPLSSAGSAPPEAPRPGAARETAPATLSAPRSPGASVPAGRTPAPER